MADQIDFFGAFCIPKIDCEDEEGGIDLAGRMRVSLICLICPKVLESSLNVKLGVRRIRLLNNEPNAWWWCYGSSVL